MLEYSLPEIRKYKSSLVIAPSPFSRQKREHSEQKRNPLFAHPRERLIRTPTRMPSYTLALSEYDRYLRTTEESVKRYLPTTQESSGGR